MQYALPRITMLAISLYRTDSRDILFLIKLNLSSLVLFPPLASSCFLFPPASFLCSFLFFSVLFHPGTMSWWRNGVPLGAAFKGPFTNNKRGNMLTPTVSISNHFKVQANFGERPFGKGTSKRRGERNARCVLWCCGAVVRWAVVMWAVVMCAVVMCAVMLRAVCCVRTAC